MKGVGFSMALMLVLAGGAFGCSDPQLEGDGDGVNQVDSGDGDLQDVGVEDDVDEGDDEGGDEEGDEEGDEGDDEEELIFEEVDPVECAYPSSDPDCPQGDFGPASFFANLYIVPDETCCADLTGDGEYNNVLGNLVGALEGVDYFGDVNQNLENSLAEGDMTYLIEASGWDHPRWDSSFDLFIHEAGSSPYPAAVNRAGEGAFRLRHWSIIEGTNIRRYGFGSAYVFDGQLVARDGIFQLRFPGLIDAIDAQIEKVTLEGTVVQDPAPDLTAGGGFTLKEGRLGGAVMRDALFETMNEAAQDCECMGDDVVLYFYEPGQDRWNCGLKAEDEAACVGGTFECRALAQRQLCFALAAISTQADVDVDGKKALSIGMYVEGVPTEILGVMDPPQ